jgi:hypothetical protein
MAGALAVTITGHCGIPDKQMNSNSHATSHCRSQKQDHQNAIHN